MTFAELKGNTFWIDYKTYSEDVLTSADSISIIIKDSAGTTISSWTITDTDEVNELETGWYQVKIDSSSLTSGGRYSIQFVCVIDSNPFTRLDYIEVI
jgi:hypothetical protein